MRHGLAEDVFHRGDGLAGTVSRRGRGVDLHAVEQVVAHDELRAAARINAGQGAQRGHFTRGIPHVKLAQVLSFRPVVAVGLYVHLPLQAETVEEIDQRAAHERLYGLVEIIQRDLLGHRFSVINLDSDLGNAEQSGGHHPGEFGPLAGLGHKHLRVLGEKVDAAA